MTTIKPRARDSSDEELGAVGVGASVRHRQKSGNSVLEVEVLVGKVTPVDGVSSSPVTAFEITTLDHEILDDTMEEGTFVTETFLAGAKCLEIGGSLRNDTIVQPEHDTTSFVPSDLDVEEDLGTDGAARGVRLDASRP